MIFSALGYASSVNTTAMSSCRNMLRRFREAISRRCRQLKPREKSERRHAERYRSPTPYPRTRYPKPVTLIYYEPTPEILLVPFTVLHDEPPPEPTIPEMLACVYEERGRDQTPRQLNPAAMSMDPMMQREGCMVEDSEQGRSERGTLRRVYPPPARLSPAQSLRTRSHDPPWDGPDKALNGNQGVLNLERWN